MRLVAVVGPTATGKSALALSLAERFDGEIIACDSTAVYRGIDIGTDKVPIAEQRGIPHHLIDVADPRETYTAARFAKESRAAFAEIRARGAIPFLVGGSGLYVRAAEEGLFEGPAADEAIRRRLIAQAETEGSEALHAALARVDPETAARLHPRDRVRVIRALEVWETTGTPLSEHHARHRRERAAEAQPMRFALEWPAG